MARAILILALLVATAAAARDLMQVEHAVTPVVDNVVAAAPAPVEPNTPVAVTTPEATVPIAPEATMAVTTPEATVAATAPEATGPVTTPEAPPTPAEASLAATTAAAQPARGVCYFDASTQSMVFHRGTVLPTTAPAGAQFCIVNLRQPALDTCGAANVIVGADKECTCVNGFALDPLTGVCVAATLASTPEVAASVATKVLPEAPIATSNLNAVPDSGIYAANSFAGALANASTAHVAPMSAPAASCVDTISSTTCAGWKANLYCGNTYYSGSQYVSTSLCPKTCSRCGECLKCRGNTSLQFVE